MAYRDSANKSYWKRKKKKKRKDAKETLQRRQQENKENSGIVAAKAYGESHVEWERKRDGR